MWNPIRRSIIASATVIAVITANAALAQDPLPTAEPDEVGLSAERLAEIRGDVALAFMREGAFLTPVDGLTATRAAARFPVVDRADELVGIFSLSDIRRIFLVARDLVVVAQLLALLDVLDGVDEHPPLLGLGGAVAIAAVIDEARLVATAGGVDHRAAVGNEQECVVVVRVRIFIALVGILVREPLAMAASRSPRYSMMRVPLGMNLRAKQP